MNRNVANVRQVLIFNAIGEPSHLGDYEAENDANTHQVCVRTNIKYYASRSYIVVYAVEFMI